MRRISTVDLIEQHEVGLTGFIIWGGMGICLWILIKMCTIDMSVDLQTCHCDFTVLICKHYREHPLRTCPKKGEGVSTKGTFGDNGEWGPSAQDIPNSTFTLPLVNNYLQFFGIFCVTDTHPCNLITIFSVLFKSCSLQPFYSNDTSLFHIICLAVLLQL